MEENDAPKIRLGKREGGNHREWPDLVLLGGKPGDPTYPPIGEEHSLYALAAWVYHHAGELEQSSQTGLLEALGRAWPRRGRPKSRYVRGLFIALLIKSGVPEQKVAEKWWLTVGEVTDVVRDFCGARRNLKQGVEVEGDREPYDPATQHGRLLSLSREMAEQGNEDWRLAEELAQELGYASLADLANARRHEPS